MEPAPGQQPTSATANASLHSVAALRTLQQCKSRGDALPVNGHAVWDALFLGHLDSLALLTCASTVLDGWSRPPTVYVLIELLLAISRCQVQK